MSNTNQVLELEIPQSIWQIMLSGGMLLTCGTFIQHAFRGMAFPWKSGKVIVYASQKEKLVVTFTRSLYFGTFSWLLSLILGALVDQASSIVGGTRLTQRISHIIGSTTSEGYTFLASAILILILTPLMILIGAYLRKRSGKEYTERMKMNRKT